MNEALDAAQVAVFRVGSVVEVNGRTVRIQVDKSKNGSHLIYRGNVLKNVSVGGYIKIAKGFGDIVGKVDGEAVREDQDASGQYGSKRSHVDRVLSVSLLGFFDRHGKFQRGVRELPLIDNDCFLLTQDEFDEIHSFVGPNDVALTIGTLSMEKGQPVRVGVDALFASHVGIFGNTGSGKSYTLAKLYHELFKRYRESPEFLENARFLLLDFNGEYVNTTEAYEDHRSTSVITENAIKREYVLSTRGKGRDRIPISKKTAEDPAFWTVLLDASEKTQAPFIQRTLESNFWDDKLKDDSALKHEIAYVIHSAIKNGDTAQDRASINHFLKEVALALGSNAPASLDEYTDKLHGQLGYHNNGKTFYYKEGGRDIYANDPSNDKFFRELTFGEIQALDLKFGLVKEMTRIRFKLMIQYYSDVFRGFANREHIGPVIKRLETRMPAIERVLKVSKRELLKKPLTVISLRDVNLDMKKVIPLLLCRQLYDAKKKRSRSDEYLNLIIDEAHNILSTASSRESEGWKDYRLETFEEIVKEGRKFGVFLTIASQRPHDISDTIVSQLHNYFLHRLVNNLDINAVEKAVSYLDKVSFDSLPILPTGTCILSGVSAQVPVLVGVNQLATIYEPNSKTMTLNDKWSLDEEPSPDPNL